MKVNIIIPSLFPRLCNRAIISMMRHGVHGVGVLPIVVAPEKPCPYGIRFVEQKAPLGLNPAMRLGMAASDPEAIIVLAADDVLFEKGWLDTALTAFLKIEADIGDKPFVMGIRHIGGIGTCYGRMYGNFPMFRRSMLTKFPELGAAYFPDWITGWGDVELGMAVWLHGGEVRDSGTPMLIHWGDRMGYKESPMKYARHDADVAAMRDHFPTFAAGWPAHFRGFNVDCPPSMLKDGTIYEPDYQTFAARVLGHTNFEAA